MEFQIALYIGPRNEERLYTWMYDILYVVYHGLWGETIDGTTRLVVGLSDRWVECCMRPRDLVTSRDSPSHVRRTDLVVINVTEMGKPTLDGVTS